MSVSPNGFNRIAPYYDFMKRIVFGKSIYKSQVSFLPCLPKGGNFLIIGGGTGEILKTLTEQNPGCAICYVEASSKMLALAVGRLSGKAKENINFLQGTEAAVPEGIMFDAVITNFFLDLYPDRQLDLVCKGIGKTLKPEGIWLASDFVDGGKSWQRALLLMMYWFFRITCRIAATRLPSWEKQVRLVGMKEVHHRFFFGRFIKSVVYYREY